MSNAVPVPPELDAFLRYQSAQALMIRGPPGSGKTMLALALVESFQGRRIYVSLRVDRPTLLSQFPWLGSIPPEDLLIVDSSSETDHVQDRRPLAAKDFVLSQPSEAKELEEFHWLPHAVQTAWSLASGEKPTIIIFDSWDAIIDQYFERSESPPESLPSRIEVERLLIGRMMRRPNLCLVIVLERDSSSVLDYIVHGIAETSRRLEEGRLERWLSLPKLRGIPIPVDTYPFTLAKGRFTTMTPAIPDDFAVRAPVDDPHPDAPGLWPGSTDYAGAFGRLLPGRITLIELAASVPREIPRLLMAPMFLETIRTGGRGVHFSAASLDPEEGFNSTNGMVLDPTLSNRTRVMTPLPLPERTAKGSGRFVPFHWSTSVPSVPLPDDPLFLKEAEDTTAPSLIVAYLSGLEAAAETAGVTIGHGFLSAFASSMFPKSPVHIVVFASVADPLTATITPISDVLIKIRYSNGRIFLDGHRPYSAPLILSNDSKTEPYRLTPIL
jgi:KaiC/GvpD/RAD55 family RecA-like ATPase